jgi:predicted  nucleic acid-binding Zn-ribbon protein
MFNPKSYEEERSYYESVIRAIRSDISDPVRLIQEIDTLSTQIKTLQDRLSLAQERQDKLPELLVTYTDKLAKLNEDHALHANRSKINKLQQLRDLINELSGNADGEAIV